MVEKLGDSLGEWMESINRIKAAQEEYELAHPKEVAEWRKREEKKTNECLIRKYLAYGIPDGIADELVIKNYPPLPVEQEMLSRLKAGSKIIILCGLLGTGKTIAACRWLSEAWDGEYVKAFDYCALSDHMDKDRERINTVRNVESLVLDELSMEVERDQYKIEALLHHRLDRRKLQTVVLINKSPNDARKHIGARITSRVFECGDFIGTKKIVRRGEIIRQNSESKK